MKKIAYFPLLIISTAFWISGCVSTPDFVDFDGQPVSTFSVAAGCNKLGLDEDCSGLSGSTRKISIDGLPLRAAGGNNGKIVFLMSDRTFIPDEGALRAGAKKVKAYLEEQNLTILETKVMASDDALFGVHFTADGNAYQYLKALTVVQ